MAQGHNPQSAGHAGWAFDDGMPWKRDTVQNCQTAKLDYRLLTSCAVLQFCKFEIPFIVQLIVGYVQGRLCRTRRDTFREITKMSDGHSSMHALDTKKSDQLENLHFNFEVPRSCYCSFQSFHVYVENVSVARAT